MAEERGAPTDVTLASAVARYVELQDVALRSMKANLVRSRRDAIALSPWEVQLDKQATYTFDETEKVIRVEAKLELQVVGAAKKAAEPPLILDLACLFELDYAFRAKDGPEGDDRERHFAAFASVNGIYNAWPYFRELVQSTTARMGLPPLTLPVHRVASPAAAQPSNGGSGSDTITAPRSKRKSRAVRG